MEDEIKDTPEEIIAPENKEEEKIDAEKEPSQEDAPPKKNDSKKLFWLAIVLFLVLVSLISVFIYQNRSDILSKLRTDKYGFEFNFNKVRSYDWDTLITEKKVAKVLNVSPGKITTIKNPVSAWVLEDPKALAEDMICASILDNRIVYEDPDSNQKVMSLSVVLCKDNEKIEEIFEERKKNVEQIQEQDENTNIITLKDIESLGKGAYIYLIERNLEQDEQKINEKYSGLFMKQGPLLMRIEEIAKDDSTKIFSEEEKILIAKYIGKELKRILTWY